MFKAIKNKYDNLGMNLYAKAMSLQTRAANFLNEKRQGAEAAEWVLVVGILVVVIIIVFSTFRDTLGNVMGQIQLDMEGYKTTVGGE